MSDDQLKTVVDQAIAQFVQAILNGVEQIIDARMAQIVEQYTNPPDPTP